MLVALSELARRRLWPGAAHDRRSVTAPALLGAARLPSVRDIALQRAYVRAFLDRSTSATGGRRSSTVRRAAGGRRASRTAAMLCVSRTASASTPACSASRHRSRPPVGKSGSAPT